MTDRELLEAAARGPQPYSLELDGNPDQWQPMYYEGQTYMLNAATAIVGHVEMKAPYFAGHEENS